MRKNIFLTTVLFLLILLSGRLSHAVLDRYNVGVGYSASNQLSISTDSPGEFDYSLYLRTADNTAKTVSVHYNGVSNLQRTITLGCGTDESNATDNPQTGTCLSGGPFVRGAFVAGNNSRYATVKRFTLFCGSVQIVGEQSTDNWSSGDFYNDAIRDFLDNGASSTWCPPTSTPSPTPTKSVTKTIRPTARPTRRPTIASEPTPIEINDPVAMLTTAPSPIPTKATTQTSSQKTGPDKVKILWIGIVSILVISAVIVISYIKIFGVKTMDITPPPIDETKEDGDSPDDTKLI